MVIIRPDIMKILKNKVDLPPPPPIFNKDELISKINSKLAEELIGSVPIKLMDIKNPRRTWISYEYHLDIIYTIDNDPKQLTLLPNNFYDQHYELSFFDQLYNRLAKIQQSINNGA